MKLSEEFRVFLDQLPAMIAEHREYQRAMDRALAALLPRSVRRIPVDWWMKKLGSDDRLNNRST